MKMGRIPRVQRVSGVECVGLREGEKNKHFFMVQCVSDNLTRSISRDVDKNILKMYAR